MRLIDADELIKTFEKITPNNLDRYLLYRIAIGRCIQLVERATTAYDVDKVTEQLNDEACDFNGECHGNDCYDCPNHKITAKYAIEIVKAGGIE